MLKIDIKKNTKEFNEFAVNMRLTEGAILALLRAIEFSANNNYNPIVEDIGSLLKTAMTKANIF